LHFESRPLDGTIPGETRAIVDALPSASLHERRKDWKQSLETAKGIGIVARKSFLDQYPDVAERTLKALSRSIAYYQYPANKKSVVAILSKWLRL